MSWFYNKFKKSDDDSTVTLTSDYIQITGAATLTGALTQTGAQTVTGNMSVTGNILNTGNLTVTSTARVDTSPIYLGTATVEMGWGAVDAAKTGVYISGTTNYAIGSLYINTTYGTVWVKTDHASTAWGTLYATPST
jgi:hypothetical protein